MILTTMEAAPGQRVVAVKGLVQGNTIRARHLGRDIMAGLRNIVGGEISEYTRLMTESRMQSTQRMIEQAEALGANAVIGVRFVTSMVMSGASELLAYGTAVVVEDEPGEQATDEAPGEDEASSQDEGGIDESRSLAVARLSSLPTARFVALGLMEPTGVCWCGCGRPTKSMFARGDDAKFHSFLRKYENGEIVLDELPSTIRGILEKLTQA